MEHNTPANEAYLGATGGKVASNPTNLTPAEFAMQQVDLHKPLEMGTIAKNISLGLVGIGFGALATLSPLTAQAADKEFWPFPTGTPTPTTSPTRTPVPTYTPTPEATVVPPVHIELPIEGADLKLPSEHAIYNSLTAGVNMRAEPNTSSSPTTLKGSAPLIQSGFVITGTDNLPWNEVVLPGNKNQIGYIREDVLQTQQRIPTEKEKLDYAQFSDIPPEGKQLALDDLTIKNTGGSSQEVALKQQIVKNFWSTQDVPFGNNVSTSPIDGFMQSIAMAGNSEDTTAEGNIIPIGENKEQLVIENSDGSITTYSLGINRGYLRINSQRNNNGDMVAQSMGIDHWKKVVNDLGLKKAQEMAQSVGMLDLEIQETTLANGSKTITSPQGHMAVELYNLLQKYESPSLSETPTSNTSLPPTATSVQPTATPRAPATPTPVSEVSGEVVEVDLQQVLGLFGKIEGYAPDAENMHSLGKGIWGFELKSEIGGQNYDVILAQGENGSFSYLLPKNFGTQLEKTFFLTPEEVNLLNNLKVSDLQIRGGSMRELADLLPALIGTLIEHPGINYDGLVAGMGNPQLKNIYNVVFGEQILQSQSVTVETLTNYLEAGKTTYGYGALKDSPGNTLVVSTGNYTDGIIANQIGEVTVRKSNDPTYSLLRDKGLTVPMDDLVGLVTQYGLWNSFLGILNKTGYNDSVPNDKQLYGPENPYAKGNQMGTKVADLLGLKSMLVPDTAYQQLAKPIVIKALAGVQPTELELATLFQSYPNYASSPVIAYTQ